MALIYTGEATMYEWKNRPQSITLDINGRQADVWKFCVAPGKVVYRWTVRIIGAEYLGHGDEATQDEACERALVLLEQ